MIIEENQLRPPSPKEMAARYVPLERLRLRWELTCWEWDFNVEEHFTAEGSCSCEKTHGAVDMLDAGFTTLDLIEFHKAHSIPYEAHVVDNGYDGELALDWTHLALCEGCASWYAVDTEHDTGPNSVHDYISRARADAMRWASEGSRKRRGLM